jgi:hypothetical protein
VSKIEMEEPSEMDVDEPEREPKGEEVPAVERGLPMPRRREGFPPPADYLPLPADDEGAADWITNFMLDRPEVTVHQLKLYCLTLGHGLSLKTSTLPNAGLGVFLEQPVRRGTLITYYYGVRVPVAPLVLLDAQYGKAKTRSHLFRLNLIWFSLANFMPNPRLEGIKAHAAPLPIKKPLKDLEGHGLAGWVNTLTRQQYEEQGMRYNVAFRVVYDSHIPPLIAGQEKEHLDALFFRPNHQIVFAIALRDLRAGEELLVNYGEFYNPGRLEERME